MARSRILEFESSHGLLGIAVVSAGILPRQHLYSGQPQHSQARWRGEGAPPHPCYSAVLGLQRCQAMAPHSYAIIEARGVLVRAVAVIAVVASTRVGARGHAHPQHRRKASKISIAIATWASNAVADQSGTKLLGICPPEQAPPRRRRRAHHRRPARQRTRDTPS